jgi:hypothetical protein
MWQRESSPLPDIVRGRCAHQQDDPPARFALFHASSLLATVFVLRLIASN